MLCITILLFFASVLFTRTSGVYVAFCHDNPGGPISINWLSIQPERISLRGNVTVSLSTTLHEPLTGNLDAQVTLSRRFGVMWMRLPCLSTSMGRIGSCTYSNLCNLLNNGAFCREVLARNGISCSCPFLAQTYNLQPFVLPVDLASVNRLAAGEYQGRLRIRNRDTMTEVLCLNFYLEMANQRRRGIRQFLQNLFT